MTVAAINAFSGPYAPNGATTSFPFTFQAKSADEVKVQIDGGEISTGFSVTLNSDGTGSVDFDIAPAATAGDELIIFSSPLFTQTTSFENAGAFQPRSHDAINDRSAIRDIYLRDRINASIRAPFGETMTALPLRASRAGKFLAFDAGGDPVDSAGLGSDPDLRADLATSTGSALSGFLQSGVGAVSRTVQAKLRDLVNAADFGAIGDGVTEDSNAMTAGIAAAMQITLSAGKSYALKDVVLSNSECLFGTGQIVTAFAGGTNLLVLKDYNPRVSGLYVSSGANTSEALLRIKASRYPLVADLVVIDAGAGVIKLVPDTPATEYVALPILDNVHAEDVSGTGINIGSSVSEIQASNIHLYGKLVTSGGGQRPIFTTTGWKQNTPVTGDIAVGGHQITNANMINFNRGFHLSDAQLTKFSNCIADGSSDYGVLLDGACDHIVFADLLVGTTRGVKVAGTSGNIHFNGLDTILTGTIPPWGGTDFFNGVVTFYDLEVRDTAVVRVSNWKGTKRIAVDATAKLIVDDGVRYNGRSIGTIGAGATTYLAEWGNTPTEDDCIWRAPYDGYLICLTPTVTAAPGAGQTFTYTARVNGVDSALIAVIADTAFGNVDSWAGTLVPVSKGEQISIKVATSAGAVAARHNAILQLAPR